MQNVQKQAKIALQILHGDTVAPVEENGEKVIPGIFEIRILTNPKDRYDSDGNLLPKHDKKVSWFGFFSSIDRAYDALCRFKYEWIGAFVTINPVDPAMYNQSPDRISLKRRPKENEPEIRATSDADILYRKWLIVDVDPIRDSNVSSTELQKLHSLEVAREISQYWQAKGMPAPIIADSGNGSHLLWRTRLLVDSDLHKRFLNETAAMFNSASIDIDLSISNPSRIWKIYGTATRKGESTPERPHRFANLVEVPEEIWEVSGTDLNRILPEIGNETPIKRWLKDGRVTIVGSRESVVEVKSTPTDATKVTTKTGETYEVVDLFPQSKKELPKETTLEALNAIDLTRIPGSNFYTEKLDPLKKLAEWGYQTHNPRQKSGITIHELKTCPCSRKLTDGASALYQLDGGGIAFGCKHATCEFSDQDKKNKWQMLRELHEPKTDKSEKKKLLALPFISESLDVIVTKKKTTIEAKAEIKPEPKPVKRSIADTIDSLNSVIGEIDLDLDFGLKSNISKSKTKKEPVIPIALDLSFDDLEGFNDSSDPSTDDLSVFDLPDPDLDLGKELTVEKTTGGVVYSQKLDLTKFDKPTSYRSKICELVEKLAKTTIPRKLILPVKPYKININSIIDEAITSDVIDDIVVEAAKKAKPKKSKASSETVDVEIDIDGMLDAIPDDEISDGIEEPETKKVDVNKPGKFTKVIRGADKRRLVDVFQDWKEMRDAIFEEFCNSPDIYCSQNRLSYVDYEKSSMIAMDGSALDDQSWKLCAFVQFKQTDTGKIIAVPKAVPKRVIESLEYLRPEDRAKLRKVERVIATPFFSADGEYVSKGGYHLNSGTYMIQSIEADGETITKLVDGKPVKENLTIHKALKFIYDFLADFEFESPAERANYLGTLITPMVRSMIDGPVPMTVLEANKRGSGKSYLAKIIQTIYGEIPDAGGLPTDEEAIEKLMTSILVEGKPIHLFDNVTHKVASATLDRVLTTGWFSGRLLGKTQNLHCKVVQLFLLTANNARMSPDMSRRFVRVRLKSTHAHPERRNDFKIDDIIGWVKDPVNRSNILSCISYIVKMWISANKPKYRGIPTMGSYENWRNVIGNIMFHAGEKSWLANLGEATEAVGFTDDWEPFFDAWSDKIGTKASLGQLFDLAIKEGLLGGVMGKGDTDAKKYALRVGLFSRRDDIIGKFSLKIEKNSHTKSFDYILERVAETLTEEEVDRAAQFDVTVSSDKVSILDEIGKSYGDQTGFNPTYTPSEDQKPQMTYRPFFDDGEGPVEFTKEDDTPEEWWKK